MKTSEWNKVKRMLPWCDKCAFKEIRYDERRNGFHRFCNADKGKNLIDVEKCPQNKF